METPLGLINCRPDDKLFTIGLFQDLQFSSNWLLDIYRKDSCTMHENISYIWIKKIKSMFSSYSFDCFSTCLPFYLLQTMIFAKYSNRMKKKLYVWHIRYELECDFLL